MKNVHNYRVCSFNLHENMGPGLDRTRNPGSAVRLASVARHVTNWASWSGIDKISQVPPPLPSFTHLNPLSRNPGSAPANLCYNELCYCYVYVDPSSLITRKPKTSSEFSLTPNLDSNFFKDANRKVW